jgi:hypothetical protein
LRSVEIFTGDHHSNPVEFTLLEGDDMNTEKLTQTEDLDTLQEMPRDAAYWAHPVEHLKLGQVPVDAMNANVEGRELSGPLRGFGQMWQKTYRIRLSGAACTPVEVIRVWKENFPSFWPKSNRFYAPLAGIQPGEVALINTVAPGNNPVMSTGVMVIYADDNSFTFMTPEGHPFNGWVTFSAYEDEATTVAQTQVLVRAFDPLYEIGFRLGLLHKAEDQIWRHTLRSLGEYYHVDGEVQQQVVLIDPRVQWSQAGNVWKNAGIRSMFFAPVAAFKRLLR